MLPADFAVSQRHYLEHLLPVWHALDPSERGRWHAPPNLTRELIRRGLPVGSQRPPRGQGPVVAAGSADLGHGRPCVLVEHGAGQAYDVASAGYSGGPGREAVRLFLCPNEVTAARNRAAYPAAAVEVVGSARVEALRSAAGTSPHGSGEITGEAPSAQRGPTGPAAVALSFHWRCDISAEAGWAFPHFQEALPELARTYACLGHGHPRYAAFFAREWKRAGVEHVRRFEDLVPRARVYVCDNSSTLYEWAALGRPVVVLNSPRYRRDLDLWPRFWACADVGVQVDEPGSLSGAIARALEDPPEVARRRAEIVAEVYGDLDGRAAERSADAIRSAFP